MLCIPHPCAHQIISSHLFVIHRPWDGIHETETFCVRNPAGKWASSILQQRLGKELREFSVVAMLHPIFVTSSLCIHQATKALTNPCGQIGRNQHWRGFSSAGSGCMHAVGSHLPPMAITIDHNRNKKLLWVHSDTTQVVGRCAERASRADWKEHLYTVSCHKGEWHQVSTCNTLHERTCFWCRKLPWTWFQCAWTLSLHAAP